MDAEQTARFIALEERIAYQDRLLEDLNQVLVEHSATVTSLELRLLKLEQGMRESLFDKPGHEPPPHY
jgi:uncharacterized coiled-coil protein SlyX